MFSFYKGSMIILHQVYKQPSPSCLPWLVKSQISFFLAKEYIYTQYLFNDIHFVQLFTEDDCRKQQKVQEQLKAPAFINIIIKLCEVVHSWRFDTRKKYDVGILGSLLHIAIDLLTVDMKHLTKLSLNAEKKKEFQCFLK